MQCNLLEKASMLLKFPYRLNRKNWKPTFISFAKARKRVEILFSLLVNQFLIIKNYAKMTNGLYARIIGKISVLCIFTIYEFYQK